MTHAHSLIESDDLNHDDICFMTEICASNLPQCDHLPCITSMPPQSSKTKPYFYLAMSLLKAATENLDPGETPVITLGLTPS